MCIYTPIFSSFAPLIMAYCPLIFPFFSLLFLTTSSISHNPKIQQNDIFLKVTKDPLTLQYLTHIHKGTPITPTKLVLDLGGPFLWESCLSYVSSSYRPIHSTSLQCSLAKPNSCFTKAKACDLSLVNPITRFTARGELAEDIIAVDEIERSQLSLGSISTVQNILFVCALPLLLNGLASGSNGMLGLGRTRTALPYQLTMNRKFFVCISSSNGFIYSSDNHENFGLSYTPLIPNHIGRQGDYYIKLRSIKINDRRISVNQELLSQGVKISTLVPYTTMESSIYNTFTSAYVSAATSMNMTRVSATSPFGVCFSSSGVGKSGVGPTVPVIDFVLQSEVVTWRFHGGNSMVHFSGEVMCLGFLDGGVGMSDGVVIGGYQLEDHLLEFDLGTSMLGFSSSLLMKQTSCYNFKFSTW